MKKKLLALMLITLMLFCGCKADDPTPALAAAVDDYIQNEVYDGESLPLMLEYQNAILSEIIYEIQSYDMKKGTMEVNFTYIDVLNLADSITDQDLSEEDYYAACIEKIRAENYSTISEVVCVYFEASEEGYTLTQSDELANVLSGGVLDYYLELMEEMGYE